MVCWMVLSRINSYLNKHFGVELQELDDAKGPFPKSDSSEDGLFLAAGESYFRPVGSSVTYRLLGAVDKEQSRPLEAVLGLLLDSWVTEHNRTELLAALEEQLLHQMFLGDKVIPFRRRTLDSTTWAKKTPHRLAGLKLKRPWQPLLAEPSDALFIGQEIHRLLGHQIFMRISHPSQWLGLLHSNSERLSQATIVVELEEFPRKSFLIKERPRVLGENTFLLLQSQSTKKLLELPHAGGEFIAVSGDLKSRFTYKYLKDCARKSLGLEPLHRYLNPLLRPNLHS